MLNQEFKTFYRNWRKKADNYDGDDIQSAFDRFFTLYVIYNRLYAEVTFRLEREGQLNLATRTAFPDTKAATEYVSQYLGAKNMMQQLDGDPSSVEALRAVIVLLTGPISDRQFYIKLDKINGSWQRNEDIELLRKLQSNSSNERAVAVLDFIYSVRCNLIHGHKGFDAVQIEVIGPATALLTRIINILFERLSRA